MLLKELYVRPSHRRQGTGRALMAWVARHALEHGCARIDWHVAASNRPGLAFYRALGALHVAGRLNLRLGGEYLSRLAGEDADDD
jgi:GNAT superfamily N-acetyltransferase